MSISKRVETTLSNASSSPGGGQLSGSGSWPESIEFICFAPVYYVQSLKFGRISNDTRLIC